MAIKLSIGTIGATLAVLAMACLIACGPKKPAEGPTDGPATTEGETPAGEGGAAAVDEPADEEVTPPEDTPAEGEGDEDKKPEEPPAEGG